MVLVFAGCWLPLHIFNIAVDFAPQVWAQNVLKTPLIIELAQFNQISDGLNLKVGVSEIFDSRHFMISNGIALIHNSGWICVQFYESLEGSFSYEFAYEFAYAIPPTGPPIGYLIGYEIIDFNRKLHMLLDMEMNLPGFRTVLIDNCVVIAKHIYSRGFNMNIFL